MRCCVPGRIDDRLWYLGREESGIYLLEGDEGLLVISGGMSYLAPLVSDQMKAFGINEGRINKLLMLHAHFDHIGLVPFFYRRRYPNLEVYGSDRAWKILGMPKGLETINAASRFVAQKMGVAQWLEGQDLDWRDDIAGSVVTEGTVLDLGGITVRILETPGHSSCSISAYCPETKTLFPSDGGGIPYGDAILPAGNSNYTKYQESLVKLGTLPLQRLCSDHNGYVMGRDAESFIARSSEAARHYRAMAEAIYRRTRSIDATTEELVAERFSACPDFFIGREIFTGVCRQTVRHLASVIEGRS
jgi:glyoxylase-like metal-dependent hydrolase (beta-lactamase superfamily II)